MKIHVISRCPVNTDDAQFSVVADDNGLSISATTGETITITAQDVSKYSGGLCIQWSAIYNFVFDGIDDLVNDKGLAAYVKYNRNVSKTIAVIIPNEDGTELAAVFYAAFKYAGDTVPFNKVGLTAHAVDEVFPGYAQKHMKSRDAKINLLREIGAHDSLSSLEKQVDLLTRLVLELAKNSPSDVSIALSAVLASGDSIGSTSPGDAVTKIIGFKKRLRQAQADYHAAKGA